MRVLLPEGAAAIYRNDGKGWPIEFPGEERVANLAFCFAAGRGFFVASMNYADLYSIAWFAY